MLGIGVLFAAAVTVGQFGGGVLGGPKSAPATMLVPGASQEAPREIYSAMGTTIVPASPTGSGSRLWGQEYNRRFYAHGKGAVSMPPMVGLSAASAAKQRAANSSAKERAAAKRAAWRAWNAGY